MRNVIRKTRDYLDWLILSPAIAEKKRITRLSVCKADADEMKFSLVPHAVEDGPWNEDFIGFILGTELWISENVQRNHILVEYEDGLIRTACIEDGLLNDGSTCAGQLCTIRDILNS